MQYVTKLTGRSTRDLALQQFLETGQATLCDQWGWAKDPPSIVFGLATAELQHLRWLHQQRYPFIFCDHAYFLRAKQWRRAHGKFDTGTWFRLCANGLQQTQFDIQRPSDRWERLVDLGVPAVGKVTRQTRGEKLLVCPPNTVQHLYDLEDWLEQTCASLRRHSTREIRVRTKFDPRPLEEDLAEAWALVTYQSTVAIHALLAGVPIWCHDSCCAFHLGNGTQYELLEDPYFPEPTEIEQWLYQLAYGQFTLDEFRSGYALSVVEPLLSSRWSL